ncbi:MAG: copper amine oxidase N-terminal domain-containing protein [Oscillospiraceae bacterium]|nr:copper amine oxidase N-terminal domain-containing protein [Oscillospiraceae bacterium]
MKKRILTLALALTMCLCLAVPALAANTATFGGPRADAGKPALELSNFVSREQKSFNFTIPDESWDQTVDLYYATAPATVTVLYDLFSWDHNQVGDFGAEIFKFEFTDDGTIKFDDNGSLIGRGENVPLTTGAVTEITEDGSAYYGVPKGSIYVLSAGAYGITSASSGEWFFIIVKDLSTPAPALTAKPTASKVLVNGESKSFDAYNISDNNYFKLRDLAFVLNGTDKQFSVGYDEATKAIALTSGAAYTPVGGELTGKGDGVKTPKPTASKITLDGKEVSFTAYGIDGNNYFKLRDVGEAFGFGVDWDGAKNTIVIDTGKGYTPE